VKEAFVGQVVNLLSNPEVPMTVISSERPSLPGYVLCNWLVEGILRRGDFPLEALECFEPDAD
jgi:hypothetical protein